MKKSKRAVLTFILLLACFSASTYATTYQYLSSPNLAGTLAGPDLLWQTSDDFSSLPGPNGSTLTGFNPGGHASGFLFDNIPLFGSIGGSFDVSGTTVTDYNVQGKINDLSDSNNPVIGNPLFESLTPSTLSTFVVNANNTANSNFLLDVSDGVNSPLSFNLWATYAYFNNGEDYNSIFAGNQILI